ncbi:family 78 glycoside hydrolase catalytic domain [Arcicella sp. LKC2W]|uniref:family 78 glycoside hydrolase catalytic domain n=1 Tax=Arcicella sp. LKC2W TaxID=2984198 RepID=UPI002B1FEFBB|nr:family 78 glycoside hydrolase catalytic domain [Arcicella sp. LKC2W]MEA5460407.1 family 78 glycoside hydrolase catalytic domain [Arcicella sp. LKC2W]
MKLKLLIFLYLFTAFDSFSQALIVNHLRCEYLQNPLGIESKSPRLSWHIFSNQRNISQTSYQILVSDSPELLQKNQGNYWNSGKINSDESIQIAYHGKVLEATKTYYWKVKIWDNQKYESAWSEVNQWQMGLLKKEDWKGASWIAYEKLEDSLSNVLPSDNIKDKRLYNNTLPIFRKDFSTQKTIEKATMFICGLGHFEMSLNGKKVGDHFLDAGWTKYDKQALYVSFDLTKDLKKGKNTLGVMLGNGFYYVPSVKGRYRKLKVQFGYPKMICRLKIQYKDGSSEDILSDTSWKTAPSPITFSSIYGGEDYNANLEETGWDTPDFKDNLWKNALEVDGIPSLNSQMAAPLKVMETFNPKKQNTLSSGDLVFDLGQNFSGIISLSVKGNQGDTVRIYPAELLNADGSINQKASGSPFYFTYILKGKGIENWTPRFTYYGFRYLQVKGAIFNDESNLKNKANLLSIKGLHTRNSAETIGNFTCSNELFNKTNTLIDWAIKSNMASVFTDCPHREKLGWLEELHLVGASVRFGYDVPNLFKKSVTDMNYSQLSDGLVPEISPEYVKFDYGNGMFRDSPEWGSSSIIVPWYLYHWYGETQTLADAYPMMKKYLEYLAGKAKNHILSQGLGDWYDLGPNKPGVSQLTPMGVTGTAIYYYDLQVMQQIATVLHKKYDAIQYEKLALDVKKSFNETFFNPETKQYASGSQTANAMAVYMKLVEPADKKAVVENIVKDIRKRNNSLTAGDIGYRYLLRVLEDEGKSEVIFEMNNRSDVAGYGYQLAQGATALTESWQALPTVSNNHFMLGHLMEWFYSGLAGIKQDESATAFKKIIIKPQVVGDVTFAKANYQSPYGKIMSDWTKKGEHFTLKIEIPVNTTATIYLPATAKSKISVNGKIVKNLDFQEDKAILNIGSGQYLFEVVE